MTPKEKAINLVDKFMLRIVFNIKQNIEVSVIESAKECALLSVYEIVNSCDFKQRAYWNKVKEEINKLQTCTSN